MWGSKGGGGGGGQRMICQGGQTKAYFTVIYKVLHSFSRGLDTPPPSGLCMGLMFVMLKHILKS